MSSSTESGKHSENRPVQARAPRAGSSLWRRLVMPLRRVRFLRALKRGSTWGNRLAVFLVIAGLFSGAATYGALTATPPFGDDPDTIIWLLHVNLVILLLLVILIARRIVALWSGRRRGIAGSRLHVKLVFIFSLLAAMPAIIMTIFSAFFLHFGVQSWFSDRVSTAVLNAEAVAEAYLSEHQQVIRADTLAMANDLDRQAYILLREPETFTQVMNTQSFLRNLSEAVVFDTSGRILSSSGFALSLAFESLPAFALSEAAQGGVSVMTGGNDDRVRALVRLNNFKDAYLFVGRMVDPTVLRNVRETREAVEAYASLEGQLSDLQIIFTFMFVVVALLILLGAVWFGLIFSRQMVMPISSLIGAADRVRGGDLTARVPELARQDEFDVLARAFNRMTSQIQEQRDELVNANRQLDQRRRFTEAVLAGVSSGIVGVDEAGRITLANNSALDLFGAELQDVVGRNIAGMIPELAGLLEQAYDKPSKITQAEIPLLRQDDTKRTLLVRIAVELIGERDKGAVLTFDDITALQSAQRKAAWADVARRIAHEIKNPLTPIQLSAERLRRKYLKQISDDPETFSKCTDTIIHHVEDIGRMVSEFSDFARMPEPIIRREDIAACIRDALTLQHQAHPEIEFTFNGMGDNKAPLYAFIDARQIRQAVTNIAQNAIDSIESRIEQDKRDEKEQPKGRLLLLLHSCALPDDDGDGIVFCVIDNGMGLPKDVTSLTEPYVTHRDKGTGLGLAIVKKIMEDHNGHLVLGAPAWVRDLPGWEDIGGASVALVWPRDSQGHDDTTQIERQGAMP